MSRIGFIFCIILMTSNASAFSINATYKKNVKGKHKQKLMEASKRLNLILETVDFRRLIYSFPNITCLAPDPNDGTNARTKEEVISYLEEVQVNPVIRMYSSMNPFSSTTAVTTGNSIKINRKKMNRSVNDIANTLFHEYLHVAGFGHCGDNRRNELTSQSIPYLLGDWVGEQLDMMELTESIKSFSPQTPELASGCNQNIN